MTTSAAHREECHDARRILTQTLPITKGKKLMALTIAVDPLRPDDWPTVRRIYEEGIATKQATFETSPPNWETWDAHHVPTCRFVARTPTGQVLGWAALSRVSDRDVYAGVAEVSIYISQGARGQGIGHQLLGTLIEASEAAGFWTLTAGIFPENAASLHLHLSHGFRVVGHRERIGRMERTWRDVLFLERRSRRVEWSDATMDQLATKVPCDIRRATSADAPAMLEYLRRLLSDKTLFLPSAADDFTVTVTDEQEVIKRHENRPNAVMLVAIATDGTIAGLWDAMGSPRRARRHAVEFGMSVDERFRGRGLGSALLAAGLDWARRSGFIRRVELEVYADNLPAIALYEKFGFVVEGRKREAFLYQGRPMDSLVMARFLEANERKTFQ